MQSSSLPVSTWLHDMKHVIFPTTLAKISDCYFVAHPWFPYDIVIYFIDDTHKWDQVHRKLEFISTSSSSIKTSPPSFLSWIIIYLIPLKCISWWTARNIFHRIAVSSFTCSCVMQLMMHMQRTTHCLILFSLTFTENLLKGFICIFRKSLKVQNPAFEMTAKCHHDGA